MRVEEASRLPTTHAQFARFVKWGLIPEPREDGRYPEEAVERLIEARRLGTRLRSVPRRALRMRAFRQIPPDKIRDAITWIIPEIRRPKRKLRKFAEALSQLPEFDEGIIERARGLRPHRWKSLLRGMQPEDLNQKVSFLYYVLLSLPSRAPWAAQILDKYVPAIEERLIFLLLLDIAGTKRTSETKGTPLLGYF